MPTTFQWQPYQSDAPRTVADLMLRSGDAQAAAIRANGAARANAVGNIGGAVALSLAHRIQEQKDAPVRALQEQELQQQVTEGGQRIQANDAAITAAKRATLAQNVIATAARQYPDDPERAAKLIAGSGFTNEAAAYVETAVKAATSWRALRSGQIADADKANAFEADQLSRIAKAPAEQRQSMWTALQGTLKAHGVDNSGLSPTWDDAEAAKQIALYAPKPDLQAVAPGATLVDKNDPTVALMTAPNPAQAETARHNQAMEAASRLTQGREAAAQQETARHNAAMEQAANPFGGVGGSAPAGGAPVTGTQGPTGDALLKTLAPGLAAQVRDLSEGKAPFPTGMSYAKLQPLIQLVSQYDPSFDAANYNARNKARTDLTSPSGTGGKTINALNTAIQHAGKLSDLIETLDNFESPDANAVKNFALSHLGSTKVTNFVAVQPQLMKEIERAWRGAGGSTSDIEALKSSLGPNMGKQQQREALASFVDLMKGKLDATQQQRDNVLGPVAGAKVPVLFDQSKAILDKIAQRSGGATAATPPASVSTGMIEATDPQGQIHHAAAGTALPAGWKLVTK